MTLWRPVLPATQISAYAFSELVFFYELLCVGFLATENGGLSGHLDGNCEPLMAIGGQIWVSKGSSLGMLLQWVTISKA